MPSSFKTPILFLIFNRASITQRVFDQIKKVRPQFLYVAADGPRPNREDDIVECKETRRIVEQIDWPCELKTLFRQQNLGCGPAVSSAITWFFDHVEAGIILEDDCYPDLSFFPYCEELLTRYADDKQVKFIGGNNFQNGIKRGDASYYASYYPTSWGWASWRSTWELFNPDITDSTAVIQRDELDVIFNSPQEKTHWMKSLAKASKANAHIWDFHFYYALWKNKSISLTPNKNLVVNLGFEEGTHFFLKDSTKTNAKLEAVEFPLVHPTSIEVNREADKYTFEHFYSHSLGRAVRLFKENDWHSIYIYFKKRLYSRAAAVKQNAKSDNAT